ncbi:hypothetical protein DH2020_043972 [Rehmannia glutinosa]|uniref:Bet v I/Major latex protein domain-containing protein n=1 Tax=Rehmannia glutinosa TaxID=99300 RepID=A0ABR0UJ72_REHGL
MGLSGKLVSQIRTKTSGTVFYELFRYKPHHISNICPEKIERVDLLEGQWGTVGSVNHWHFNLDGKKKSAKAIIEAIDEKKKSITFNLLEGDLMEAYNTFKFIVAIDTNGEDNLVTWTLEYEKKTEDVPEPHAVMNLGLSVTKEIERCHLIKPFLKEMGLSGRLVSQISIKADVDLLHELFTNKLHRISDICPGKVKKVDLQSGQWGTVGSVICWEYIHDGETKFAKEIIEAIDEEKKSITFNVIEGDVMAWYNTFKLIVKVDNNGEDSLVTWTLEYEKKTEDVPEPHAVMNLGLSMTKEIGLNHLLVPN